MYHDHQVASGHLEDGASWALFDCKAGADEIAERLECTSAHGRHTSGGTAPALTPDEVVRASLTFTGDYGLLLLRCRADVVSAAVTRDDGTTVTVNTAPSSISGDRFATIDVARSRGIRDLATTHDDGTVTSHVAPVVPSAPVIPTV